MIPLSVQNYYRLLSPLFRWLVAGSGMGAHVGIHLGLRCYVQQNMESARNLHQYQAQQKSKYISFERKAKRFRDVNFIDNFSNRRVWRRFRLVEQWKYPEIGSRSFDTPSPVPTHSAAT